MTQLKIIYVPVALPAEVRLIDHSVEAMQKTVGGWLELVRLPGVDLWCNEEGMLQGLPLNRIISARASLVTTAPPWDFVVHFGDRFIPAAPGEMGEHRIHGNFFLCSSGGEECADITDEQIATWMPLLNGAWER